MASVKRRAHRRPKEVPAPRATKRTWIALTIFCALVVAGPLAFGAVDRITQVALLALFATGLWARPAVMLPLSRWGNRLVIAILAIVVLKEFAPAAWFGGTHWRTVLVENFGLELPWTHNPEPARALDSMLALAGAALWFAWVRTLASEREARPVLAWALVASGAVVTAVAYATRGLDPQAIYGLRFTPGWTGFGPFPNRNHTADLLAVAFVLGCGCTAWAAARKHRTAVAAGIVLSGIIFFGLLATQSRGGLLAACFGVACFVVLVFVKMRSKRVLAVSIAGALAALAIASVFGADVFGRFQSKEAGQVSNLMRLQIWQDALRMWRDAPLFGHGLRTFPQIVGLYQTLRLEDQVILHPESSWLQWLAEFGAVPVLLGVAGLAIFLSAQVRTAFTRERGFFLRAGAFAAFAALVFHSAIDVPAHRWGTLGFALAALAIGCPLRVPEHLPAGSRRTALVPLAVAIFWTLPFMFDWPAWSPLTETRLLDRENVTSGGVSLDEMQVAARYFPLDAQLHQAIGIRQVHILSASKPTIWQRHFGLAQTLIPGSWPLVATQARTVANVSPGLAIGYWQQAVERCDLHREEVLGIGVRETASFPVAPLMWGRFVESNPPLLLAYAQNIPDEQARYFYSIWWQTRGLAAALTPAEIEVFYRNAARWGTRSQFDDWMRERAAWRRRDFRLWASLLHQWGDEQRAFELLSEHIPEPAFPKNAPSVPRELLETKWRNAPKDVVNAQFLALARRMDGDTVQSDEIILAVAQKDNAPPWFALKAGYILARQGRYGEGVATMLRTAK
ncbi:MAG TPA: O-antigen ligase family protein [Chthoniobacteraceae bacterium]|nr:O-antigen ligase family protein [Chthoniobacteraceae bacterium]